MDKLIARIRKHLADGSYRNEAAVSAGILLPLLRQLGWDDSDPSQVIPEYANGNRRVDFALCASGRKPHLFVEVKGVGRAQDADKQLFEYAFHEGVPLCVLTDGNEWNFYLPSGQGNYDERKIHFLRLDERAIEESVVIFNRYLERSHVASGEALAAAQDDYRAAASRREADRQIPKAWEKLVTNSEDLLIELVAMEAEALSGYRPSPPQVMAFLRSLKQPSEPTTRPVAPNIKTDNGLAPSIMSASRVTIRGLEYHSFGTTKQATDASDALISLLRDICRRNPERIADIAEAVRGRSRNHIARSTAEIYPSRPDLARAVEIAPGWLLGLNIANREKKRILQEACRVTGIGFGTEVRIEFPNS